MRVVLRARFAILFLIAFALRPASVQSEQPEAKTDADQTSTLEPELNRQPPVFQLPALYSSQANLHRQIMRLMIAGDLKSARKLLTTALERMPHDALAHYNLACVEAREQQLDAAIDRLSTAIRFGFHKRDVIEQDKDLAAVRQSERYAEVEELLKDPPEVKSLWKYKAQPVEAADGVATVSAECTTFDPRRGMLIVLVKTPQQAGDVAVKDYGPAGELVQKWFADGTAAGNRGDLYDNHDKDHSNMRYQRFPQLTRVEYAEDAQRYGVHNGLQLNLLFNRVTLGNSSTAVVGGPFWRSQPRMALSQPNGAGRLAQQYFASQLYLYPEHRDHDPGQNGGKPAVNRGDEKPPEKGYGDVYWANTPYLVISQGSSGSDRVFLDAFAATLAAFRPEVKARLASTNRLMPTLQMIFRRSNRQVTNRADYLRGQAHPTVFDGKQLNPSKMVRLAHEITLDTLPPLCRIRMLKEDDPTPLLLATQGAGASEKLFDTPCAIARVARGPRYRRVYQLKADSPSDPRNADQSTKFHWVLLRGDADRVKITPSADDPSTAKIVIDYHTRRPIHDDSPMESNRVDIGVFSENAHHLSPPAFFSVTFPDNETREYDEQQRCLVQDFNNPETRGNYVDPVILPRRTWRDEFQYDENGQLTGWTRLTDRYKQSFTASGKLIVSRDEDGTPKETIPVQYERQRHDKLGAIVKQTPPSR